MKMQPNACAVQKVKDDMTGKTSAAGLESRASQNRPSEDYSNILYPALQVGGLSGMSGLLVGAFAGVIRSSNPTLFALASGVQWFTLGSSFTASRSYIRQSWGQEKLTPKDSVYVSAISGGVAGTAGGLLRGPRNVIPAAVMFAILGAGGQALYNRADDQVSEFAQSAPSNRIESWLNSKWSPMRPLSESEYEIILRERLLRINADIALIDQNIEALRAQERTWKEKDFESRTGSESK